MRIVILTVSDTRTLETDVSGDMLSKLVRSSNGEVIERSIVADDREVLSEALRSFAERDDVDLVLTTGGTGISPRDVTPEATRDVIEIEIPGIAEAMRQQTVAKTRGSILSRGLAGILHGTLIVNLPGSPKGVEECFAVIAPVLGHALNQLCGISDHPAEHS